MPRSWTFSMTTLGLAVWIITAAFFAPSRLSARSTADDIERSAARTTYRSLAHAANAEHPRSAEAFRVIDRGFPNFFENPELPPLAIVAAQTVDDDDRQERRDQIVQARQELKSKGYLQYLTDSRVRGGVLYLAQTPIFDQFPAIAREASEAFEQLRDEALIRACAAQGRFLEGSIELGVLDDAIPSPDPGSLDQGMLVRAGLIEQAVSCPADGTYLVKQDGSIGCSVHGDSFNIQESLAMDDDAIDRLRSRNPFFREIYDHYQRTMH